MREKEETARLGNLLEHINQELEEKTPALQQVGWRGEGRGRGGGRVESCKRKRREGRNECWAPALQ